MQVNMLEAKTGLSGYVRMLENGDEDVVYIARSGTPVAQLTRVPAERAGRIGVARGQLDVPDDFDAWDEELAAMFGGEL